MGLFNASRVVGAVSVLAVSAAAQATTISSFNSHVVTGLTGVGVSPTFGSPNTSYTITLNAGASYIEGGNTYHITDIIGVYLLADNYDDGAQAALANSGLFADDSDHRGAGSIYGWKANPGDGITVGNSHTFTWPAIDYSHYTEIGLHVRIAEGGGSVTLNIRGGLIPAPGAAALLGIAGLAATRRRR